MHAVTSDRVDLRRGDGATRHPAAVEGDVVEAHVIREDDDDVRLPGSGSLARPLVPHHGLIHRGMRPPHAGHHEQNALPPADQPETSRGKSGHREAQNPCLQKQASARMVCHGNVP